QPTRPVSRKSRSVAPQDGHPASSAAAIGASGSALSPSAARNPPSGVSASLMPVSMPFSAAHLAQRLTVRTSPSTIWVRLTTPSLSPHALHFIRPSPSVRPALRPPAPLHSVEGFDQP